MEAATSAHTGLRRSKAYEILTHPCVDTEEQTKIMFQLDGMSQIAVSAGQSGPNFAGLNGHQEGGEMSLGGTDGHLEVSPTPGEPDTSLSGSSPMDTGSDMELTRDLLRWVQRAQQSTVRAARARVEDKEQWLVNCDARGYSNRRCNAEPQASKMGKDSISKATVALPGANRKKMRQCDRRWHNLSRTKKKATRQRAFADRLASNRAILKPGQAVIAQHMITKR
jgi:hypothetical protein